MGKILIIKGANFSTNKLSTVRMNNDKITISIKSNNTIYGTTTGAGSYSYGERITITATPSSKYKFVRWNDNNTEKTREIIIDENTLTEYIAYFEEVQCSYLYEPVAFTNALTTAQQETPDNVHLYSSGFVGSYTGITYGIYPAEDGNKLTVVDGVKIIINNAQANSIIKIYKYSYMNSIELIGSKNIENALVTCELDIPLNSSTTFTTNEYLIIDGGYTNIPYIMPCDSYKFYKTSETHATLESIITTEFRIQIFNNWGGINAYKYL